MEEGLRKTHGAPVPVEIQILTGNRAPSWIPSGAIEITQQYVLMLKAEDCVLRSQEAFRETDKRYIDTAVKIQTKLKF